MLDLAVQHVKGHAAANSTAFSPGTSDISRNFGIWLIALGGCILLAALSFSYVDVPLADHIAPLSRHIRKSGVGVGSNPVMLAEAGTVLLLAIIRLVFNRIPSLARTLALACLCSMLAYAFNSFVLKTAFGVPNPSHVLKGAQHAFHWFDGTRDDSFPSGHMALSTAFAVIFMTTYPRAVWLISAGLLVIAILLLLGNWHFLSDLIIGSFVGSSVGLYAARLRTARHRRQKVEASSLPPS
ncbi:hypothetical protein GCM10023219_03520 [Stakelama sediminis]|uniref:phosphatase PAP2 family protein n=1 Tax=Stakelama sediminis TaxID=463200 RepID=UPI001613AD9E|nr:phosphatase PAP2 family protein [Stakelama sediminis]